MDKQTPPQLILVSGVAWLQLSGHMNSQNKVKENSIPIHDVPYRMLRLLSVTSLLCSIMNKYIDIIISQNTTQFMYFCTTYFTMTCFGPF